MGVLIVALVVDVAEADGLGESLDGLLIAGKKVPACLGPRSAVALQVGLLLGRRQFGLLARVEADRHHVEVLTDVQRHIQ